MMNRTTDDGRPGSIFLEPDEVHFPALRLRRLLCGLPICEYFLQRDLLLYCAICTHFTEMSVLMMRDAALAVVRTAELPERTIYFMTVWLQQPAYIVSNCVKADVEETLSMDGSLGWLIS